MEGIIFGDLSTLPDLLSSLSPYKVVVLTNTTLKELWLEEVLTWLKEFKPQTIVVPDGEKYKDLDTVRYIWEKLLEMGFTRRSLLIGLGGGVITDIAGFVASTYMRGTYLGLVPTTLLAQVDAAIGGKTGINFYGKNIIGTFYLPKFVLICRDFLKTLPMVEILNGLAEVVKYGILDKEVYNAIKTMNSPREIVEREDIIKKSVAVKLRIVEEDLKENGKRRVLNLGHTVGHAIEKISDYKIKHGFAVSMGLVVEAKIGEILYGFDSGKVVEILTKFGLPVKIPFDPYTTLQAMKIDKKAWYGKIVIVVPVEIGKANIEEVDEKIILQALEEAKNA
ncbi:3-dehydroquinate synthase [Pyrococcus furiosus DSM 3638]|uniref:3-dehydroquinate synthase n=3 Tax=Pyrococcus furiosus TaxID=2261 RepID=AROB_PYRFU|nr:MULTISPECIES: 3-dehydroquinate synthase [Pyrococcus]Q8U0A8.1 RecName: Full=3-dehydroquinate synthase; Short=DHQS [Pyrococcus furiosus DSM 3638]AAL81815.1 3-dehydroquinate synthase [Pyrococcus furiosus DSM 3638]AFN04949.1 3-dehydroquinate synthase [Pyrococcus furiosus COM1]MDK2870173.1 3-dehydroquinate synthase [Pyrococcus sp.]QEK79308.1 3-dehydroquinate synthase [Pyrococcus furiosus DSM 3638]